MTKNERDNDGKLLNNLTEFLANDDDRSIEALKADLSSRGIDVDAALAKFRHALAEHAPTWRDKAQSARESAARSLVQKRDETRTRAEIIKTIEALVGNMQALGAKIPTGAYHHRFDEASDEDLRSLLQDVHTQYEALKEIKEKDDRS